MSLRWLFKWKERWTKIALLEEPDGPRFNKCITILKRLRNDIDQFKPATSSSVRNSPGGNATR